MNINKFALDDECLEQTKMMDEAIEECIAAVEDYNLADLDLKQRKSELDQEIRENPESYGITKITEGSISAAIVRETEELSKTLIKAESRKYAAILRKEKVIARAAELKNLINLYLNDYFMKGQSSRMEESAEEVSSKRLATVKSSELTDRIARAKKIKQK